MNTGSSRYSLSNGAIAGIVVSSAVTLLLLIAGIALFRIRARRAKYAKACEGSDAWGGKPELDGKGRPFVEKSAASIHEMDDSGSSGFYELEHRDTVHEADGGIAAHEIDSRATTTG